MTHTLMAITSSAIDSSCDTLGGDDGNESLGTDRSSSYASWSSVVTSDDCGIVGLWFGARGKFVGDGGGGWGPVPVPGPVPVWASRGDGGLGGNGLGNRGGGDCGDGLTGGDGGDGDGDGRGGGGEMSLGPQSVQSAPRAHKLYDAPAPPSSQIRSSVT